MTKVDKIFDIIFLLIGIFVFVTIVLWGSVGRKLVLYILPIFLLLKFLVFRYSYSDVKSLLSLNKFKSYYWLVFHVFVFSFIPYFMEFFHQDLSCDNKPHWATIHNSFYYFVLFLYSVCFINVFFSRIKEKLSITLWGKEILYSSSPISIIPLSFSISFFIQFLYTFVKKLFTPGFELLGRFDGGGGPNTWAAYSSITLITIIAYYSFFKKSSLRVFGITINLKILINICLFTIIISIVLTAALTNFIGLIFASLSILLNLSGWFVLAILVSSLLISISMVFILDNKSIYPNDLVFPFNLIAKKFVPRMRLWSHVMDKIRTEDFSLWWQGLGFCEYIVWAKSLLKVKQDNIDNLHNFHYHYFFLYGFPGLYAGYAYLVNIWKRNRYTCAIVTYILVVSCSDSSNFISSGPHTQFWLSLPFFLILKTNKENETSIIV